MFLLSKESGDVEKESVVMGTEIYELNKKIQKEKRIGCQKLKRLQLFIFNQPQKRAEGSRNGERLSFVPEHKPVNW